MLLKPHVGRDLRLRVVQLCKKFGVVLADGMAVWICYAAKLSERRSFLEFLVVLVFILIYFNVQAPFVLDGGVTQLHR